MQTPVIFEDLNTATEYEYPDGLPHLPRTGETLTIWDDDGEPILDGTVASVRWSMIDDGFTVIIQVKSN